MLTQYVVLAVYMLAVALDAAVTERRMEKFGPEVELNNIVRWLARKLGLRVGIFIGLFIPAFGLAYLTWPWPLFFGMLVGFRLCFAAIQLMSLRP